MSFGVVFLFVCLSFWVPVESCCQILPNSTSYRDCTASYLPQIHFPLTDAVGCSHPRSTTWGPETSSPITLTLGKTRGIWCISSPKGHGLWCLVLALCHIQLGRGSTRDTKWKWNCTWFSWSPAKAVFKTVTRGRAHVSHHRSLYVKQALNESRTTRIAQRHGGKYLLCVDIQDTHVLWGHLQTQSVHSCSKCQYKRRGGYLETFCFAFEHIAISGYR